VDLDLEGKGEDQDTDPRARVAPVVTASPHSRSGNLINGAEQRRHGTHAWCSLSAGRDGLCVPAALHRELIGRLGRDTAAADLRAWYPTVVTRYAGQPVTEDAFPFWRREFAAWLGPMDRPKVSVAVSPAVPDAASTRAYLESLEAGGRR
jgi:hypothetical protein